MLLPFLVPWLVIHTSAISFGFPPVRFRTENEHKEDRNETISGSDRVPPTSGGQTDDFCTFVNHMEMHACAHAYAHAHMHTYIFTPTSTHEMRTRTHVHRSCLRPYANATAFFDANLEKMPCRTRKRPQRPKSSFEHKPWKLQNGVKVTTVLHF